MSQDYFVLPTEYSDESSIKMIQNDIILRAIIDKNSIPNIEFPTAGGKVFWDTIIEGAELRLQVNWIFKNARIIDKHNVRLAWGSSIVILGQINDIMNDIMNEIQDNNTLTTEMVLEKNYPKLSPGDVIGIKRPMGYSHFAVYIGNDRVIHFAGEGGDMKKPSIHEAPMSEFLDGQDNPFVMVFSQEEFVYSPEETIKRAKSVLGANEYSFKQEYNLIFNNCEHFAIWCKTGKHHSEQVDSVVVNCTLIAFTAAKFTIPFIKNALKTTKKVLETINEVLETTNNMILPESLRHNRG